jgi:hypothetical protein
MDRSEEFLKKQEAKRKAEQYLAASLMDDYEDKVKAMFYEQQAQIDAAKAALEAEKQRQESYGDF